MQSQKLFCYSYHLIGSIMQISLNTILCSCNIGVQSLMGSSEAQTRVASPAIGQSGVALPIDNPISCSVKVVPLTIFQNGAASPSERISFLSLLRSKPKWLCITNLKKRKRLQKFLDWLTDWQVAMDRWRVIICLFMNELLYVDHWYCLFMCLFGWVMS